MPAGLDRDVERELLAVLRYRRRVLLVYSLLWEQRHELGDSHLVVCLASRTV
jgi:hypothetical protein